MVRARPFRKVAGSAAGGHQPNQMKFNSLVPTFFAFVCFCFAEAAVEARKQQVQPELIKLNRPTEFPTVEKENLKLNTFPLTALDTLRIVTFDVSQFHDIPGEGSNVDNLLNDVRSLNASAILFQNILAGELYASRKEAFDAGLDAAGFKHLFYGPKTVNGVCNMIASKYPLTDRTIFPIDQTLALIKATIKLGNGQEIYLLNTKWNEVNDETQQRISTETLEHIKRAVGAGKDMFVLGGNFNTTLKSNAIQGLLANRYMNSAFSQFGWTNPKYTSWNGKATDHIFVGGDAKNHVLGAYVLHTTTSYHLPVFVDLDLKPSTVAGTPQIHPTSYAPTDGSKLSIAGSLQKLAAFVEANKNLNDHIPAKPPVGGMRIVTFNVNNLTDILTMKNTLYKVILDTMRMKADVYFFQEIVNALYRTEIESDLNDMGYLYRYYDIAKGATLGNLIASRYPLNIIGSLDLGSNRIMLDAEIDLKNGGKLGLLATHWDNKDQSVRENQANMTVEYIKRKSAIHGLNQYPFVLGGDFNATLEGNAIKTLTSSGLMLNSFQAFHCPNPNVTNQYGRAVDFLWAGNHVKNHVVGAYVYYTASSDHLPIIMDLNLEPAAPKLDSIPTPIKPIGTPVKSEQAKVKSDPIETPVKPGPAKVITDPIVTPVKPEPAKAKLDPIMASIVGSPQNHPVSFRKPDDSVTIYDWPYYEYLVNRNQNLNLHIPPERPDNGMRVISFNVNGLVDFFKGANATVSVLGVIKKTNPDVCLFEEIHKNRIQNPDLVNGLINLGYHYFFANFPQGSKSGNMIASRYPLSEQGVVDLKNDRTMVDADVTLKNGEAIKLFAGHWDESFTPHRISQADETVRGIKARIGSGVGTSQKFVLGATLYEPLKDTAASKLVNSGLMTDSFAAIKWPHPTLTRLKGDAVDYVFTSNEIANKVAGSYVYYTLGSTHLALIVDLNLDIGPRPGAPAKVSFPSVMEYVVPIPVTEKSGAPPTGKPETPPTGKPDTPPTGKPDTPPTDTTGKPKTNTPPSGKPPTGPTTNKITPPPTTYNPPGSGGGPPGGGSNSGGSGSKKSSGAKPSSYTAPKIAPKNPGSSANNSVFISISVLVLSVVAGLVVV